MWLFILLVFLLGVFSDVVILVYGIMLRDEESLVICMFLCLILFKIMNLNCCWEFLGWLIFIIVL